jgi:hypothetical protein
MNDRTKLFIAIVFFLAALVLPLIGLGLGWYYHDLQTGLLIMFGAFLALFILGGLTLAQVRDLNWLTVSLPYLLSLGYTLSPDLIPLGADDAAVTALGSLMTYALALRKDPNTPRWIIVPLLAAAVYVFFGGFIPGGIDELVVNLLAIAVAAAGANRASQES